jgi:siroheme synthase
MGLGNRGANARLLLDHGRDARYPDAVVAHGTADPQRTVVAPLGEIAGKAAEAGIQTPALIVVGGVAGLRDRLRYRTHTERPAAALGVPARGAVSPRRDPL